MSEPLSPAVRRDISRRAHQLPVAVQIGRSGLAPGSLAEVGRALERSDLVKVKLAAADRAARQAQADELARHCQAQLVDTVGHHAILYRASDPSAS